MAAVRRSKEEWKTLLSDMDASPLTQKQWCFVNNVNYNTMREMKRKLSVGTPVVKTMLEDNSAKDWLKLERRTPRATNKEKNPDRLEIRFNSMRVTIEVLL
jgi:recombination DNA repair RAD52 pathway protein